MKFLEFMLIFWCAILLLIPVACTMSILEQKRLDQEIKLEMKLDNCKLTKEFSTGRKIYCGKACWRDEIQKEFACNSGAKIIIN